MNIQKGLERVSAVWWGLWGLFAAFVVGAALINGSSDGGELFLSGVGGMIAAYAAHRVTCWVVAGFFAPRS